MFPAGFSAFGPAIVAEPSNVRTAPDAQVGQQLVGPAGDYELLATGNTAQTTQTFHLIQQLVLDNLSALARKYISAQSMASAIERVLREHVPDPIRELAVAVEADGDRAQISIRAVDASSGIEVRV